MPRRKNKKQSGPRAVSTRIVVQVPRSKGDSIVKRRYVPNEEKETALLKPHPFADQKFGSSLAMGFAGMTPLPHTLRTKLKYAEHVAVQGTTGALGLYVFNASSLYDPNYTGTGHQPRGFDQLIALYDHFVVLKSRIRVSMAPTTLPSTQCIMCGVALSAVVTNMGDWDDYAESPVNVVGQSGSYFTYGGVDPVQFQLHYTATDFMGIPDPLTADKLQGTVSANPVDNAFYHVFAQDAAEGQTVAMRALVEIEYDAVFIEPVQPSAS